MASPDSSRSITGSSISGYEGGQDASYIQVRTLGRGAFGEAVLYRKTEDNSLVVWKEIELSRLSEKERRDAQTEIDILALLNHANIVNYYNHFLDGETLLIEMEYANGGSLYHKIAYQPEDQLFDEELIVWYFYQIVSAVSHIHDFGIIHRDIKTLNIFLTKSGLIKLGDFGISRVMDSKAQMANSYVGTPYYMSPELISGKEYDTKTDMWAVGCVVHELCALTRTFDASNPLRLASNIVRGGFADIHEVYSQDLRDVVNDLLKKDPKVRPSSWDVLNSALLAPKISDMEKRVWELNSSTRRARVMASQTSVSEISPVVTSKSCEAHFWGGGKMLPHKFDMFKDGKCALKVAAGSSHFAIVTVEKELFTWASSQGNTQMCGQLGHGDMTLYKSPKKVTAFEGISIKLASCGEDFTACVTDEGSVYTFGSDYYGCLGCDNEEGDEVMTPLLLDFFLAKPVGHLSCGYNHIVALTNEGEVYSWGCGEFGRLGLGSEDDYASPQKVKTPGRHIVRQCCAGHDGSFLLTHNGRVLACGSNEDNKLGFNCSAAGLRKRQVKISYDIPCKYTFATVKTLNRFHVVDISAGTTHSSVITEFGQLITFGCNKYGQLGVGDYKKRSGINVIAGVLSGKRIEKVACGDGFTVVATSDKHIYSWGNGENGRLGAVDQGGGPNGQSTVIPRPIFGALHSVSDLSCSHWHTLIVAEKVLSQKTIRSPSSSGSGKLDLNGSSGQADSVFNEGYNEDDEDDESLESPGRFSNYDDSGIAGLPKSARDMMGESSVPSWLKAELDASEFIPVNHSTERDVFEVIPEDQSTEQDAKDDMLLGHKTDNRLTVGEEEHSENERGQPVIIPPLNLSIEPEAQTDVVQTLKARILQLEAKNAELTDLVQLQQRKISELEGNRLN